MGEFRKNDEKPTLLDEIAEEIMSNHKYKISLYDIIFFVGFLSFLIPASYAIPNIIYKIWRISYSIVSIVSIILCISLFINNKKLSKGYFYYILFYIWIGIIRVLISETKYFELYNVIKCIGFISYLEFLFNSNYSKHIIKPYLCASLLLSLIHFLSFIFYSGFPGGMRYGKAYYSGDIIIRGTKQNWYFLTYDNDSIYYFLPTIILLFYISIYENRQWFKLLFLFYVLFIIYMYVNKKAATVLVSTVFLFGTLIYYYISYNKNYFYFKYKLSIIIGVVIDIFLVFIVDSNLAYKISMYFGKSSSFSGRLDIWKNSLYYILKNPIIGNGLESYTIRWLKIGQTHCHNIIIEIFYLGGIIGAILFINALYHYRPKGNNTFLISIFSVCILCYFIVGSMDWLYYNPIPFSIYVFNYQLNKIHNKNDICVQDS